METAEPISIFLICAWFGSTCSHMTITCHKIKMTGGGGVFQGIMPLFKIYIDNSV